jgi:hypothetical protein
MGRIDWLLLLVSTVLIVGSSPATAGDFTEGDYSAFAIKSVGPAGDIKTRLWSGVNVATLAPDLSIKCDEFRPCYPWKIAIVSTVFWVGETGSGPANSHSAWVWNWVSNYGGIDDPVRRNGYEPARFKPLENPFYAALQYGDMERGRLKTEAARVVPWFITAFRGTRRSVCKGHWLEIRHGLKTCYAQWQDVGPFRTDLAAYVFGDQRPAQNVNHGAGIDVSPAVRDYLGLRSLDLVDWRFVEESDVPAGSWSLYDRLGSLEASR